MMKCPKCHVENPDDSRFCGRCGAPFGPEDAAFSLTKTIATPIPVPARDTLIAGKYKIIEELGRGGMGVVYKAEDLKLKRCVALKFLPPHLMDSPELKERFLIEAQAAAALSHPNICVIHEVGEDEARPYIAMEYVEGETLRDRVRKGPLKTEEAVDIILQVAAGLGEAHAKGIIHRDIKSANIMVTEKGRAKVMDFGLAKLRGGSSLTRSQTTLGTVAYMSPEQARGDELDPRTDIWSLGVVLYEMLTGELPFRGDRDLSVIHSIVHEEPKPLRQRKPPIPEELQQVVAKALKKNREARYASAGDMSNDLRKYHEALQAEAAGLFNLRSLLKRLRRPAVAVPTALAVVVIGAGSFFYFSHQAKVRWARQVALPEIERMIEENDVWRNLVPPFRLAEKAEAVIPRDPKLADLFTKCSLNIDVKTEPPGAKAYMKEYATPDAEWAYVGETPIEKLRMPIGIFRWKFEKEGYETVLAAASTWAQVAITSDKSNVPYDLKRVLDKEGSIPPGMVRVPGMKVAIGALNDYFIDKCEVTNRQFKEFVDSGGYRNKDYWKHKFVKDGRELTPEEAIRGLVDQTGLPGPSSWYAGEYPEGQGNHPVSGVSWYEAAAYAEYVGKSLPTRFHWLIATGYFTPMRRAPQLGGFAIFSPFSNFGGKGPVPVGSLQGLTPYGVYDMAGNVREWCWNETPHGRLVRGGAWDDSTYMFDWQSEAPPLDRSVKNGFRCVVYPDSDSVPEAAFRLEEISTSGDLVKATPVPDAVFEVYRELYSYDKTTLNARMEYREESPRGWVREKVSFDAPYGGERVMAYLFLPKNARPPFQTVIYAPADPCVNERSSRDIESYFEFSIFLSYIAKNGRAVVFPICKGMFERGNDALQEIYFGQKDSHQYTQLFIEQTKDFKRTIDYLETRRDIDIDKLAFYGMCSSAALGAIIPAVEERLKTNVLVAGGIGPWDRGWGRPEVNPFNFVTRVKTPTLMLNGKFDVIFPLETSSKPLFELLGSKDKIQILYETDHIPPRSEFIKETLAWLDKYLGPVER